MFSCAHSIIISVHSSALLINMFSSINRLRYYRNPSKTKRGCRVASSSLYSRGRDPRPEKDYSRFNVFSYNYSTGEGIQWFRCSWGSWARIPGTENKKFLSIPVLHLFYIIVQYCTKKIGMVNVYCDSHSSTHERGSVSRFLYTIRILLITLRL